MYFWNPFPFVRLGMALACGILAYYYFPTYQNLALWTFLGLVVVYTVFLFSLPKTNPKTYNLLGFTAILAIFSAGYYLTAFHTASNDPDNVLNIPEKIEYYTVTVISNPQEKTKSYKLKAQIESLKTATHWQKVTGTLLLYLPLTDSVGFEYGDQLLIKGQPQRITPPTTPQEFDFSRHMALQQTYHQHFLKENTYQRIGKEMPNYLIGKSLQIRNWADQQLRTFVKGQREYSIATAITLGFSDRMDNELRAAYSEAGIMHLLAVSGMHVGIIFLMLSFVFQPLQKLPYGKSIFTWTIVLFLVCYAFLTGLSPSVLRAVLMFSLVVVARNYQRHSNIFNTIAVSIFILLCYDPYLLFSVSCQLSYLAVLGIIWFYPKIYKFYTPKHKFVLYFYQIFCMTIAAQLSTFPISLYYFHQFPNYFWLANLVILPFAGAMLWGGMLIVMCSFLPVIPEFLGGLYEWFIKGLNWIIFSFEKLPFATWQHLDIGTAETLLLYALIFGLIFLFEFRRFRYVLACSALGLSLAGFQWTELWEQKQQKILAIYHFPHTPNLHLIKGTNSLFLIEKARFDPRNSHAYNFWIHIGLTPEKMTILDQKKNNAKKTAQNASKQEYFDWVLWENKKILIWEQRIKGKNWELPACDYLIIRNNVAWSLENLDKTKIGKIILDTSNSFSRTQKLKNQADSLGFDCHAVAFQGSYIEHF